MTRVTKQDVTTFARYFANMAVVASGGSREKAFALIDELRDGVITDEVEGRLLAKPGPHAIDTDPARPPFDKRR
jgi:hypothetical protein